MAAGSSLLSPPLDTPIFPSPPPLVFRDGQEPKVLEIDFTPPFARVSMISGLEDKLGEKMPMPLEGDEANAWLQKQVRPFPFHPPFSLATLNSQTALPQREDARAT